jgi:hypothetical protein
MSLKSFENLLKEVRDQHNQELDELRLQLESKEEQIIQYKIRIKQLEIELKVFSNEEREEFGFNLRSISTQTDTNNETNSGDNEDNGNHCLQFVFFYLIQKLSKLLFF